MISRRLTYLNEDIAHNLEQRWLRLQAHRISKLKGSIQEIGYLGFDIRGKLNDIRPGEIDRNCSKRIQKRCRFTIGVHLLNTGANLSLRDDGIDRIDESQIVWNEIKKVQRLRMW